MPRYIIINRETASIKKERIIGGNKVAKNWFLRETIKEKGKFELFRKVR